MTQINDLNKIKIIIADDDATTRLVLRLLLEENSYSVLAEAEDGEDAVNMCARHKPDIAFIDIQMPKLDGHQVALMIQHKSPQTAVIMVSSISSSDNVKQALMAGAKNFVVKPFDSEKLVKAIRSCAKRH